METTKSLDQYKAEIELIKKELEANKLIINKQAEELKELDHIKSRFFTNISHEFRTPLSVISGMAQTLVESEDQYTSKAGETIEKNSKILMNLINQLLDLVKMEAGKLEIKLYQADIILFVEQIIEAISPLAESKGISLSVNSDLDSFIMDFDQDKLFGVLSNLITNGVKFSDIDGSIIIDIKVNKDIPNPEIFIKIIDDGIGISENKLPYIFDRFFQADHSRIYVQHGTGVGLNFVKELVELMGGQIDCTSFENVGTTFNIHLPISNKAEVINTSPRTIISDIEVDQREYKISDDTEETEGAPTLLIIEDNRDVSNILQVIFKDTYNLLVAKNGQEGIDKALEYIPDLILSDVMMPEKDGIEVLNELKNHPFTSHIPIILLTAKADMDSKIAGLKRGADDYISKPFNNEELKLRSKNILENKKRIHSRYNVSIPSIAEENPEFLLEDQFIKKIEKALDDHLDDSEFKIEDFCHELSISRMQLHNKLKALTGMSTSAFLNNLRLNRAIELVSDPNLNISEIGYAVGYSSHSYFSKKFHEKFGTSPKSMREIALLKK